MVFRILAYVHSLISASFANQTLQWPISGTKLVNKCLFSQPYLHTRNFVSQSKQTLVGDFLELLIHYLRRYNNSKSKSVPYRELVNSWGIFIKLAVTNHDIVRLHMFTSKFYEKQSEIDYDISQNLESPISNVINQNQDGINERASGSKRTFVLF